MKFNFSLYKIFARTKGLILHPQYEWDEAIDECNTLKNLYINYLIPLSIAVTLPIFIGLFFIPSLSVIASYAFSNIASILGGTYLTFLIIREYLKDKNVHPARIAANLSIYSAAPFIVFHSLSIAFVEGLFSQLLGLISLCFIRTLYCGIWHIAELDIKQRSNLQIMLAISIIFMPLIINKLLSFLFGMPVFYL